MRVERLETWSGPGQNEALSTTMRAIRADLVAFRTVQKQHGKQLDRLTADVAELKTDVAELKTDVAELKTDVAGMKLAIEEILRRVPAPPAG